MKNTDGIVWPRLMLVLAFVLAFLSVGSMGVLHDALHQRSVLAWQRLELAGKIGPDLTGNNPEATHIVSRP
jgi:hypothetical protein